MVDEKLIITMLNNLSTKMDQLGAHVANTHVDVAVIKSNLQQFEKTREQVDDIESRVVVLETKENRTKEDSEGVDDDLTKLRSRVEVLERSKAKSQGATAVVGAVVGAAVSALVGRLFG